MRYYNFFGSLVSVGILNVRALCFLWGKVVGIRIFFRLLDVQTCPLVYLMHFMVSTLCLSPFGQL